MRHLFLLSILLLPLCLRAQEKKDSTTRTNTALMPVPRSFVSRHEGVFGGKKTAYTATASETLLHNTKGEPVASIWSVAYTLSEPGDPAQRPVMFVFNGGPGSASMWLHMGMFGPQMVLTDSDARRDDGAAPYTLVPNPVCPLDITDLVFVDPVGTGYSRPVGKGRGEDFWGLKEDAASVARFIRKWITDNKRWASPKYLAGESFGTMRAVAVTSALEGDGQNMAVNGLVLISQALDYEGSTSVPENITSYITYLPSMAATAWYHKKAGQGQPLTEFLEECRRFTYNTYTPALYKGNLLTAVEKKNIADQLAYFTGLDRDYILKSDLKILMPRFQKQLLAEQGLAVGRLDGRYMGEEWDQTAAEPHLGDPSAYQISAAYTAALNQYMASELKVEMDRPYLTSNDEIGDKWRWRTVPDGQYWEPMPANVARQLGESMRRNTDLRVLVASGYFDLICPFFDTEITFARNGIVPERVTKTYYEAGHMMYTHAPDRLKLAEDVRRFLKK